VSLMKQAFAQTNNVIVSIFVNPLQFDDQDDLARYPRTLEADIQLCQQQGITAIFVPSVDQVYPTPTNRSISSGRVGDIYEGEHRKGHFDGVLAVVNRLFEMMTPDFAVFGEKDYQQLFLVRQMAADLHPNIRIVSVPTVREADGLAISSRNTRLSASDRILATRLFESLATTERLFLTGQRDPRHLEATARNYLSQFGEITVHYLVCVDAKCLLAIDSVVKPARILLAATVGDVRLIDNILLKP
ncbi:MAG: pantoate--beta-alanine ligase, partial [Ilumatobacteraceae bacterium]